MLNRNAVWPAFLLGLIFPAVIFALLFNVFSLLEKVGAGSTAGLSADFRMRTTAIVAIAANLFLMNLYKKRRWSEAMRGVVMATTVLAMAWVVFFGARLF